MSARTLSFPDLLQAVSESGFRVKKLASWAGVDVRTLERQFDEQLRMTPKAWIIGKRMAAAHGLLARRFSNKEVAVRLGYGHALSFCRDFKRRFGCPPQEFARRLVPPAGERGASG
jgi:AraC family carnitine catabolism transcriptional activator